MSRTYPALLVALVCAVLALGAEPKKPYTAKVSPADPNAEQVGKSFRLPPGMTLSLWAAEPLLANPVAFCFDNKGRVYVAETFRLHQGVSDIRGYLRQPNYWLDDDLACRSVADRIAMTRNRLGQRAVSWAVHHDRVRRLEDTDGKGRANKATVFADGFSRLEDGIGAGVLARGDSVWYTCIPDLVRLRDPKDSGVASERQVLSTGYGVHMGYIGHDLHGLILGPDGRLYFSIGDRGLNVVNKEGKRLFYPDTGCVLRCELDGSNLEVFASGLRNPQELAFDDFGNLFTGDNNSDGGDAARWVYVMQGGDSGWRIGYQFGGAQSNRGPFNAEKLWHPPHKGQAAWIVPPIANLGDGPSGLVCYPGVGLPDRYKGYFFLADFRGGPGNSGIRSFTNKPKGAGFELADSKQFLWRVLATDVDFGPDGAMYVSDWVNGWGLTGKGRIWRLADNEQLKQPIAIETKKLLGEGFEKQPVAELEKLLGHQDRRVRQETHLELAGRNKQGRAALERVAFNGKELARRHAIWGLGIQARRDATALVPLRKLLTDADAEVRAQACRVIGDAGQPAPELVPLLKDESARVRSLAALALGQTGGGETDAIVQMLARNNDADPWLRHAGVMALARSASEKDLTGLTTHSLSAVRLAAVVALRRQASPAVAQFLDDAEPDVVTEAARAINDAAIEKAMPALADLLPRVGATEPTLYRALNAAYRLGTKERAEAVARFAARADVSVALRKEALHLLENWAEPSGRDRILGIWRPLPRRSVTVASEAMKAHLPGLFTGPKEVQVAATRAAATLGVKEVVPTLLALVKDETAAANSRAESLRALQALKDGAVDEALRVALRDGEPEVRAAGREVLARVRPEDAIKELQTALEKGVLREVQSAYAVLGSMKQKEATAVLEKALDTLVAGKVPAEARLDLVVAAERQPALKGKLAAYEKARPKAEPFGRWRDSLVGGDAEAGKAVFLYKSSVSCLRCHKVPGHGSAEVGPDLTGIGAKQNREYLLESIVYPSKQIAKGFETVQLQLVTGVVRSGILKSEDAKVVRLMTPEGATIEVKKDDIEERTTGKSAMPEDIVKHLTREEMRDLVEYLASLKEGAKK